MSQWVCQDCRSVNADRAKRCYKCGVPRSVAEMSEASASSSAAAATQATTVLSRAARIGARYRLTWPLAVVVAPLIVASTVLYLATASYDAQVLAHPRAISQAELTHLTGLVLPLVGVTLLGVVFWSIWIALVTANVPALTGAWTPHGPIAAFLAVFIPIIGFKRPYTIVRDVLSVLTGAAIGPLLIAMFWWWSLLVAWFGPAVIVVVLVATSSVADSMSVVIQFEEFAYVVAAVLALAVLALVELAEQRALRDRATAVFQLEQTHS